MKVWGRMVPVGAAVCGLVLAVAAPAAADHESTGMVLWAGEGEVVLFGEDEGFHILAVTPRTLLRDERGGPTRRLEVGDIVWERCAVAPEGGATAIAIDVVRRAGPRPETSET